MNKQLLWLSLVLLIGYLALVFCDENAENSMNIVKSSEIETQSKELFDEARTRRRHKLFRLVWGWHALAIAYWIKVKVVIVAFFLGSAVFLGLRYFWPNRSCKSEISHDGPIIYDSPHTFSHHDHIPYALDHSAHFDHSFEPYSAYSGAFSETGPGSIDVSGPPPDGHSVKRRSLTEQESQQRQAVSTEEQIAELMFSFLGLDSKACRRRFICEMEFRSKLNPISSMAFRIVGRGFFEKYTNARNKLGRATSFSECANVNPDCVFIEQTDDDNEENIAENAENENTESTNVESEDPTINSDATVIDETQNDLAEVENQSNLAAERRHVNRRRRKNKNLNDIRARFFPQSI